MSKVYDAIKEKKAYRDRFKTWEASELIIDETKALYELRKPGSEYQKVCMYRDGPNAFFYGDYGQFSFDNLTWLADPHNLQYDNIGYQMEKLNRESKDSLMVFVEDKAIDDIIEWAKERLEEQFDFSNHGISTVIRYFKGCKDDRDCHDAYDFSEKHPSLSDAENFIDLVDDMIEAASNGEIEYYAYINSHYTDLGEYDEMCESQLWNAGKTVHQRFYICLYAMEVCGKKLARRRVNKTTQGSQE